MGQDVAAVTINQRLETPVYDLLASRTIWRGNRSPQEESVIQQTARPKGVDGDR